MAVGGKMKVKLCLGILAITLILFSIIFLVDDLFKFELSPIIGISVGILLLLIAEFMVYCILFHNS